LTSTSKAAEADVAYIDAGKTLRQAGHLMRELGVGELRVRGENGKIQGIISRDMVVRRIAAGGDPKTVTVGEVASAGSAHRGAPAHPAGARPARRDHGSLARNSPGLVALPAMRRCPPGPSSRRPGGYLPRDLQARAGRPGP
jgi:CBS domain-containing protein